MKRFIASVFSLLAITSFGQNAPNDCSEGFTNNVCNQLPFQITSDVSTDDVVDFGSGTVSNPSTNPNPGNSGCLLSGETSSTFMLINVATDGTLEWSIGTDGNTGCYDWIMWPVQQDGSTCSQLQNATLPPVACNWNGNCEGFTGMAASGNMPAGGDASNFENAINVSAGEQYLLCLSNYSFQDVVVPINFFGSASIACSAQVPDQTICNGETAEINIILQGITNPSFTWNTTVGVVGDPAAGPNFEVNPTVTTDYEVYIAENGVPTDTVEFTITVFDPPTPNAGNDVTGCFGDAIQLNGVPSDANNTCSWSFLGPDGTPAPPNAVFGPNNSVWAPDVQVNYPGEYRFIMAEGNEGCPAETDTVLVTFNQLEISSDITNPSCMDSCDAQIQITSLTAVEYSIDEGNNWQNTPDFTGLCDGTYVLQSKDGIGCLAEQTITITDPAEVMITVSNDTLICIDGTASMSASASNGTSFNFHWNHTNDLASNQNVMPDANTQYEVYAENENGCLSSTATIGVSIRTPIVGTISPDVTVCPGYPTTLVTSATGGIGEPYTFNWFSPANVNPSGSTTLTVSPTNSTIYLVEITDGCETPADTVEVRVNMAPVPNPIFAADTTESCEPGEFRLQDKTLGNTQSIEWNVNGNSVEDLNPYSLTLFEPGFYDVQLIVTNSDGCIDSVTVADYLKVHPNPIANFTHAPFNPTMFNPTAQLNNLSTGADVYAWDFGPLGSPTTSNAEDPKVTYPDATTGTYPVQLIVTSEHNCVDSMSSEITVVPELLIYAPNTFTPDQDEYNPTWKIVIDGIDLQKFEINVYNRWGELVWQTNTPNDEWDGKYRGKLVETGTYVWTLTAKDLISDKKYTFNGHLNVLY